MPPQDEVTSLTAIGPAAAGQQGGVAFTTTHWSVVLTAQGESPAAEEALEKLCRMYWRPIYSFVRRQGVAPEEAEDLTQGFFAQLLERGSLSAVRKEKGRLRSYLLGALKYFLADEQRRAMAIKRGKGQRLIPLEELRSENRVEMEPADPVTAEMIYERRWALTVLEQVLDRLKNERFTDFGNAINRYCERKLPTRLRHLAISKMSCAISSPWSRRNVWENLTEYKRRVRGRLRPCSG